MIVIAGEDGMRIVDRLRQVVGEAGVLDASEVARKAGIWREDTIRARAIIRPATTAEVATILAICHEARQPVVIHGGLTGLVRGADSRSTDIVLSLERMREIERVDAAGRTMTTQAGVTLQRIQEAAAAEDLFFPLDLGARGSAQIGGNIATNAGGNRVIRFGMIRDMVLGLEAVLADGTVLSSMNQMLKNNAGYDLKQLFVGTEGTLGVVTRAVLRLREAPVTRASALVAVDGFDNLTGLLRAADRGLGGTLAAFEVMWQGFYRLVTTSPATGTAPLARKHEYYALIEALGGDPEGDAVRFERMLATAWEQGLIADAAVAQSEAETAALWALRDDVDQVFQFPATRIFDVSLPLLAVPEYLRILQEALARAWSGHKCFVFGHLGDGNIHLAISPGSDSAETTVQLEEIVYRPLPEFGGSVSAEHGIGIDKKPYLGLCRSQTEIALMARLKAALDPRGILNPGVVVDMPGTRSQSSSSTSK